MGPTLQAVLAATASFFVITLLFAFIFIFCKSKKKAQTHHQTRNQAVHSTNLNSITVTESATFDPTLPQISMRDLLKATNNFSPDLIIGDGSFGLVYKATLTTCVTVAVKKLSPDAFQGFREFRAEMETLGKIQHPNIVKMLGYCITDTERVLIYEFIQKGSLDQWLCDTSSSDESLFTSLPKLPLSWETRISITKDVAQGLCYMHNLDTPIIHRDIKASNILLDSKFVAHIADFGLARMIERSHSHVSTQVAGTMGYMPPEYIYGSNMATVMGDVYSFGILMLEIGTGRRPNWPFKEEDEGKDVGVVEWATKMVAKNKQMEMVDAGILRDELKEGQVVEFFRIAKLCTSETGKDRPTMKQVVELLDQISTLK